MADGGGFLANRLTWTLAAVVFAATTAEGNAVADFSIDGALLKNLCISVFALTAGAYCWLAAGKSCGQRASYVSKFAIYFGAQTGMTIYMKTVLSAAEVSSDNNLRGHPGGFMVTGIQQVVAFVLCMCGVGLSSICDWSYRPKKLKHGREWIMLCIFSVSFAMNNGLNLYGFSLVPLSVNVLIRACLPVSTFVVQQFMSRLFGETAKDVAVLEIVLMGAGVACACLAVYAQTMAAGDRGSKDRLVFGSLVLVVSNLCASINYALAGVLGNTFSLNSLDSAFYMSLPAACVMCFFIFFYSHAVPPEWAAYMHSDRITDWSISEVVWNLRPSVYCFVILSGVFSLAYNVFCFNAVTTLSATHLHFAGNFNKAATILIAVLVGMENLPEGKYGWIMLFSVVGNIGVFSLFSWIKSGNSVPRNPINSVSEREFERFHVEQEDDSESSSESDADIMYRRPA
eukprot:TRINITY_DN30844_c0_g1_i1.p1 TRINITY_DN30844_c0_g1~~TRINITY_DN30844_c0_g1_i1.p1  ORF type:complete len:478 (-),score=69.01 TRINITY_DN30844_c0_g1_i1:39-1406(-)